MAHGHWASQVIGPDAGAGSGGGSGAGGIFVVHGTMNEEQNMTLDKTWQQIVDAISDEQLPVVLSFMSDDGDGHPSASIYVISDVRYENSKYYVTGDNVDFQTDSPNGYPSTLK